jgi:NAD(P)-dependent dehydrogenase (short-subunit alcohol dehydrogenase family)
MGKLDGRVALVTGGASGLGRASGLLFAREGATVVFADMNAGGADAAAEEVMAAGGAASGERLDVTSGADCERAVAAVVERYGRLDIVMTSAGVGDTAPVAELDQETFERTIRVNLTGTFLTIKAAFPALAKQGGSVVALASVAGIVGAPGFSAYGASKAGVIHLVRILAIEGAGQKIRVNAICPSWVWTPMVERAVERMVPGAPPEVAKQFLARQSPLGRMATTEDISKTALYLASDDSAFVTGQAIPVDGGLTAGPRPL